MWDQVFLSIHIKRDIYFTSFLLILQLTLVYLAASNMENASKGSVCVIIIITSTDMNVHVSPSAYFCLSRQQGSEIELLLIKLLFKSWIPASCNRMMVLFSLYVIRVDLKKKKKRIFLAHRHLGIGNIASRSLPSFGAAPLDPCPCMFFVMAETNTVFFLIFIHSIQDNTQKLSPSVCHEMSWQMSAKLLQTSSSSKDSLQRWKSSGDKYTT